MKIVVMSDSHTCNQDIDYVLEKEVDADIFLHCGDICVDEFYYPQIITVQGNNDYFTYPMERIVEVGSHRIIMFHSHQFPYVRKEEKMREYAKKNGCDILCFGHTHLPYYEYIDGVHMLNPGSLYYNRNGSGKSYACILIDENDEINVDIIYMEKKL